MAPPNPADAHDARFLWALVAYALRFVDNKDLPKDLPILLSYTHICLYLSLSLSLTRSLLPAHDMVGAETEIQSQMFPGS